MTASRIHLVRCAAAGLAAAAVLYAAGADPLSADRTATAPASRVTADGETPDDFIWLLPTRTPNGPDTAGSARV